MCSNKIKKLKIMLPEEFIKEKIYEMVSDVDELNEWECQVVDLLIDYALSIN